MKVLDSVDLTYCTNIHPSKGWEGLFTSLKEHVLAVKEKLSPERSFGLGLCLSNNQVTALAEENVRTELLSWLQEHDLYVCTINGFVHQEFHNPHIKDTIHSPDWASRERVEFTRLLVEVFAGLLPEHLTEAGISTQPLSYKYWDILQPRLQLWETVTAHLLEVVLFAIACKRATGKLIHIDLEPEPDCLLENTAEVVQFFKQYLLPAGRAVLGKELGLKPEEAEQTVLDHVRVCYDTCHGAVAYEQVSDILEQYSSVGIKIGKVQISSALKVPLAEPSHRIAQARWLERFAEDNFLHQVIQRNQDGSLTQFRDLPEALPHITEVAAREWRIHFHVPIFLESLGEYSATTQGSILQALKALKEKAYTNTLEVETYTWGVLPVENRLELTDSIERELRWVLECLD